MKLRYALLAALVGFVLLCAPPAILMFADAVGLKMFLMWGILGSGLVVSFGIAAWTRG